MKTESPSRSQTEPRRRIVRQLRFDGVHLGAEYNADHGSAGPSMNELVAKFRRGDSFADPAYFRLLVAQVACFGDPGRFFYDDVSRVRAGGRLSPADTYRESVRQSVPGIVAALGELHPRLIIVAGGLAYEEFCSQVLPQLPGWRGDVVRARNPSAQGHRGSPAEWLARYRAFQSGLIAEPVPAGVRCWHLASTEAQPAFHLARI